MSKARDTEVDIIDEAFEKYESDIRAMLKLLKNGMGVGLVHKYREFAKELFDWRGKILGFMVVYLTYELSKALSRKKVDRIPMSKALKSGME